MYAQTTDLVWGPLGASARFSSSFCRDPRGLLRRNMKSCLVICPDTGSVENAVAHMVSGLRNRLSLQANSCGIIFCEPGYPAAELSAELHARLGIDIIGCTAAAQLNRAGHQEFSIALLVLTADDCAFASTLTEPFGADYAQQLNDAYDNLHAALGARPAMLYFLTGLTGAFPHDAPTEILSACSGGAPLFGAVASDFFSMDSVRVFRNGDARAGAAILLGFAGNIKPRFVVRNVPPARTRKSTVTGSQGVVVKTIDNKTACEFMTENGVDVGNGFPPFFAPLGVEYDNEADNDGVIVCRSFARYNLDDGSATAFARIPEGASVSVLMQNKADIQNSCRDAMEAVRREFEESRDGEYEYSTALIVSCLARYTVLARDRTLEGGLAREILPKELSCAGFYSYGEYCPSSIRNGVAKNRFHNNSIVFCLI